MLPGVARWQENNLIRDKNQSKFFLIQVLTNKLKNDLEIERPEMKEIDLAVAELQLPERDFS